MGFRRGYKTSVICYVALEKVLRAKSSEADLLCYISMLVNLRPVSEILYRSFISPLKLIKQWRYDNKGFGLGKIYSELLADSTELDFLALLILRL